MKKYLFQFSEIPYRQFQQLGIDEIEVQRMFTLEDIERLLLGRYTGLKKNIQLKQGSMKFDIDAKFFLTRGKNNVADLMIFSRKESVEQEYGLSERDIKNLERGGVFKIQDPLSKQLWWFQLDTTINWLFRAADDYVKTLNQSASPPNHKQTDADYYDWEYIIHKFETQKIALPDPSESLEKPSLPINSGCTISIKDFLKNTQSESNAFSQSIFEKYGTGS
jgi:Protein of unknown function (DUF4099)